MASGETTQGQVVIECGQCQNPVSSFCRRCGVNLCDPCVPIHLRVASVAAHDVVDYFSKDDFAGKYDEDTRFCDLHPKLECSAYCKTCELSICLHCVSINHKSHEISELPYKAEELLKVIAQENDRLQSFKHELKKLLNHTTRQLSSLSSLYQKRKHEVTAQGKEWHKYIDKTVKKLHQELDDLKKESEAALQKQKNEFEEMLGKIDEMNRKSTKLQKTKNVTEMQKFRPLIQEQKTMKEFTQYTFPIFHECKIDENSLQTFLGYIDKMPERKIFLLENKIIPDTFFGTKVLEVPSVSSVIDTGFPADDYSSRLYDMAVTDDKKVWMGGHSRELKLFDLQGNLQRTVTMTSLGMYICMYNKQVVFSDHNDKDLKMIYNNDTVVRMFTTGDWEPYGITGSASGDLLVCLLKGNQSKVVRYSSTGTVLQEIQYDSHFQSLYQDAFYIAENVNGDIIVTDFKKKEVITVDRLGIFRYSYSGQESSFRPIGVSTDSLGHVMITDYNGDKIHMLDRDGWFLRYIIPEGGIKDPHAVCLISDSEVVVGECLTGLAKKIKFLDDEK